MQTTDVSRLSCSWSSDPQVVIRLYPTQEQWAEQYPGPLTLTRTGAMLFGTHPALGVAIKAEPVSDSDEWVARIWSLSSPVPDRDSCLLALNVLVATELPARVETLSPQMCRMLLEGEAYFRYVNVQRGNDGVDVLNVLLWMMERERVRRLAAQVTADLDSNLQLYRIEGLDNVSGCDGEWYGWRMRVGCSSGEAWMYLHEGVPGLSDVLWSSYISYDKGHARYTPPEMLFGLKGQAWLTVDTAGSALAGVSEILRSGREIRDLSPSEFAELFRVLASILKKATFSFQFSEYRPPEPGLTGFFSELPVEDFLEYRHVRATTVEEARQEVLRQHPGSYLSEPVQADERVFPEVTPSFAVHVRPGDVV